MALKPRLLTGGNEADQRKSGRLTMMAEQVDIARASVGKRCRVTGRELLPGTVAKGPGRPVTGYEMGKFS